MKIIWNKDFQLHNATDHHENAGRLPFMEGHSDTPLPDGEQYLTLFHPQEYIEEVRRCSANGEMLNPETYTCKESYKAACAAVSASVLASDTRGFAMVRPPGHHAFRDNGLGYCIFNNMAIATEYQRKKGKRVLIVDIDGHYGEGIMEAYYDTDEVMYFSLHQFPAYPFAGKANEIGKDKGKGYTINAPMPPSSGDDLLLESLDLVLPFLKKFNPDIVGVCAGFDGHKKDPILALDFTEYGFHHFAKVLSENFDDIFAILEGGYDPKSLESSVHAFIAGINGQTVNDLPDPSKSTPEAIFNWVDDRETLQNLLSKIWK